MQTVRTIFLALACLLTLAAAPTISVRHFGARGDAATTCDAQTTLSATADSGQAEFALSNPSCIAAGGTIILGSQSAGAYTGNTESVKVKSVAGATVTATTKLVHAHNGPTSTTVTNAIRPGDTAFSVASAGSVAVGQIVTLDSASANCATGANCQEHRTVTAASGNSITVDSGFAWGHTIGARASFAEQVTVAGGYVSGTDDTAALNRAEEAACAAARRSPDGAVLQFDGGNYAISGPVWVGCSKLRVQGRGQHTTALVAMPSFRFNCNVVPRGNNGQYVGMLDLDVSEAPKGGTCGRPSYPSRPVNGPEAPLQHFTLQDMTLDPRAGMNTNTYGIFTYQPVTAIMRALQWATFRNLYLVQGAPINAMTDLTREWSGLVFDELAVDANNSSHDLKFFNIVSHNGVGAIALRMDAGYNGYFSTGICPTSLSDVVYNISIDGEKSFADQTNIQDDRIVMSANAISATICPGLTTYAEFRDWQVRNLFDRVTAASWIGGINPIKINTTAYGVMHHGIIQNVTMRGWNSSEYRRGQSAGVGTVISFNNAGGGYIRDIVLENVTGSFTKGLALVSAAEPGKVQSIRIKNVTLMNVLSNRCISNSFGSAPTGLDSIYVSNVKCSLSATAASQFGANTQGILWRGSPDDASHGATGSVVFSNIVIKGFHTPFQLGKAERDAIVRGMNSLPQP